MKSAHLYSTVSYVSGPCSAGKTYALAQYMKAEIEKPSNRLTNPPKFLYVAPSIPLIREFAALLQSLGIDDIEVITSEEHPKRVTKALMRHLGSDIIHGHVTLCTHAAFLNLLYFPMRHNWRKFVDEAPQIDEYAGIPISTSSALLNKVLKAVPHNDNLLRIIPASKTALRKLIEKADVSTALLVPWFQKVLHPSYDVFAAKDSYEKLILNPASGGTAAAGQIHLLALIKPEVFHDTCILSANFDQSILFDYLQRNGCRMVEDVNLTSRLRFTQYDESIGQRAIIRYILKDATYSKTIRNRPTVSGGAVKSDMDKIILDHIAGRDFLIYANKDDAGMLAKAPNAIMLPGNVCGLNTYDKHKLLVFIAALNRKPAQLKMLKSIGISNTVIWRWTLVEQVHQSVMRTALRRPDSYEPVDIIVPDKKTALEVGSIIGCNNIVRLGHLDLVPDAPRPPPYTKKERENRSAFRKLKDSVLCDEGQQKSGPLSSLRSKSPENQEEANDFRLLLTFHGSTKAKHRDQFFEYEFTLKELVKVFKQAARTPICDKEDSVLFNPSTFDRSKTNEGYRRQEHFRAAYGEVLDFDNGNLSPEEFIRIIWKDAGPEGRLSFLITNSFSRSPAQPNRFRVFMPFRRPVMSIEHFQAVHEQIVRRLEIGGYDRTTMGLDKGCKSGIQSFWMPCKNRNYPEYAFLKTFGMTATEFQKYGIDPSYVSVEPPPTEAKFTHPEQTAHISEDALNWIDTKKAQLRAMREGRNQPFFDFAIGLRSLRLSLDDIEVHLYDVAGFDHKMKSKAKGIMKSLREYG